MKHVSRIHRRESSKKTKMKIAIVTNMIPPYRAPLFEAIGREVELTVLASLPMEPDRQWQPWQQEGGTYFRTVFLAGKTIRMRRGLSYIQPDVWRQLRRLDPDVIVTSGFSANSAIGGLFGRLRKKRTLLWSEATSYSERQCSPLRQRYRKWLVTLHDGGIAVGTESRQFLLSLGTKLDQTYLAVNAVPTAVSIERTDSIDYAASIRRDHGTHFLYAGQLIPRKGIDRLLRAWVRTGIDYQHLLIMGSGPEEDKLRALSTELNAKNVHFVGWCDGAIKWAHYFACDVFVFPTLTDVWGLALNEALSAGKPVICSPFAGAASDLVSDGVNGYVIDPNDTDAWAGQMAELANNSYKRERMGQASLERIRNYSIEASAQGFLCALRGEAPENK